jgi:magnesium chelatase family protein
MWRLVSLLDRIDLHIEVPAVPFQELSSKADGTSSATMREHVNKARHIQEQRFSAAPTKTNARMSGKLLRKYCPLSDECKRLLQTAMDTMGLSARAHDRILRMARTIADLDASADVHPPHLSEAIGYRSLDRKLWKR